jgi:DNA-binding transcriptional MerR regulator
VEQRQGWTISQVEGLIGLSRRDIQRCCYAGRGGVDVLSPADGTWGRRTYDKDDIARLFLVAQLKSQGMSLPEAKRELENARGATRSDADLLQDYVDRLSEKVEQLQSLLLGAEALLAADEDNGGAALADLISEHISLDLIPRFLADGPATAASLNKDQLTTIAQRLDDPGLALAIDLWAGPGTIDQIRTRIETALQTA